MHGGCGVSAPCFLNTCGPRRLKVRTVSQGHGHVARPSGRAGGVLCGDPVKGLSGRYGYGPLVQGVWGHMEVLRHLLHGLPVEAVGAPHG